MSFRRYPKYKESGVEWLGNVPEHWNLRRIGYFFNERREKVSDKDYPPLSVTKNGIVPQLDTAAKTDDGENRKRVAKGDFVINSRSDRKGSAGASALDGSVSLICTVLRPQENVHTPFIHHLLRSQPFQEEFYRYGKGIVADLWSTSYSEMRNILLSMPPMPEQSAIAAFLDRETAKIDALIVEKRRLMELLKEKRQAVISHALTKGLNPDAPLKPSGIEWLGDVPAHWEATSIKRIARIRYGIGEPPKYHDSGTPLIRATNVHAGHISEYGLVYVNPVEIPQQRIVWLEVGDIIVVRSGAYTGDSAIVPPEYGRCIAGFDMVIRCHSAVPEFVQFAFLSKYLKDGQIDLEKARAAQPHLNAEELGACIVVLPPTEEQLHIVNYLQQATVRIDVLTAEAQRAIDLLQERRTALISAAVTGQIDVRDLVAKEAA